MQQIIEEWSLFCEGKSKFEDGYFFTLFMDDLSNEELSRIFSFFPSSERLLNRMLDYKKYKLSINETKTNAETLESLLRQDFEERTSLLKDIPIFSNFIKNPVFRYTNEFKHVEELILDDIWSQAFHDYVDSKKVERNYKIYALHDALYGATYDFDMRLYLFAPLLSINYSVENLYDFKKMGGIYAIAENEVVYSFFKPNEHHF